MRPLRALMGMTLLSLALAVPVAAQQAPGEVMEWVGVNGGVNWTRGRVLADGVGGVQPGVGSSRSLSGALACRAAQVIAQRNMLEIIQGVRVEGETLVQNMMLASDVIRTSVQGTLRGAVVVDRKIFPDGACSVTLGVDLTGPLAADIYRVSRDNPMPFPGRTGHWLEGPMRLLSWLSSEAWADSGHPWSSQFNALEERLARLERLVSQQQSGGRSSRLATGPAAGPAAQAAQAGGERPSGLVIDARGTNFIPSMTPRLRRLRGEVIYPGARQESLRESGRLVSLFMDDLMLAQSHPWVGERPLVVRGKRTWGDYRTEIVLGDAESTKLLEMIQQGFLDEASVIIVLD